MIGAYNYEEKKWANAVSLDLSTSANQTKYLNEEWTREQTILSKQDFMDNELMLGLRKINGINIQEFNKKYEVSIEDVYPINTLIRNKELIYKKGYIFINPRKLYLMNEILLKLI